MERYTEEQIKELVAQAVKLNIPLYAETKVSDIEVLVRHKLLESYGREIPVNTKD